MSMSWQMAALLLLGGSTALIFLGMPVALSFVAINIIGAALFLGGDPGLLQVVRNSVVSVMSNRVCLLVHSANFSEPSSSSRFRVPRGGAPVI